MSQQTELTVGIHAHKHDHNHQITISPFPPVDELKEYHQFDPRFSDMIMDAFNKRVDADITIDLAKIELEKEEQSLRKTEVEGEIRTKRRAMWFAIISVVFVGFLSFAFAMIGYEKTAAALAGTVLLGTVTAFTRVTIRKVYQKKEVAKSK